DTPQSEANASELNPSTLRGPRCETGKLKEFKLSHPVLKAQAIYIGKPADYRQAFFVFYSLLYVNICMDYHPL
ncbi:hypothetical protein, partial [Paenibacillus glycanilyticus]|uniref:hypothetical protein n=1 Tax=Paenibacillus glycanilyticus TaxID=126569 RepID=UPI001C3FD019